MTNEELWRAIKAHNERVKADHIRGMKLDDIKTVIDKIGKKPELAELLNLLAQLKKILN